MRAASSPATGIPPSPAVRLGLTPRALAIAFLLTPLNSFWIVHTEIVRYAGHPTTTSLFFNVIFCLAVLVGINALLKRYWPAKAFRQAELLAIYTLLSLGTAMVGHDMLQVLISTLPHPFWFASPDNRWESLFFGDLPRWLMVEDRLALRGYMLGNDTLYRAHYLLVWARPVLVWTAFLMALIFMMICLNVVWRKQWTENERLTFPIIELPLQMTDERFSLFRSRTMWLGFALAGGIDLVNTLSVNYPSIPRLPVRDINLREYLPERPWSAMGTTFLAFFPFVVGIGYLLPLDLSFSCWFFYLFWKVQPVITAAYGWADGRPNAPYVPEQAAGAYIGVAVFVVWVSRRYLLQVLRRAFGRRSDLDDRDEPLSYRQALIGLAASFLAVSVFAVYAGMTVGVAVVFIAIYAALSIAVTRMRAEVGSPAHDLHHAGPDILISEVMGPRSLSPGTLAAFTLFFGFNRAYRTHPMPHQLEGFKLAQVAGISMRPMLWWMLLASLWGCLCAWWALLHVYYQLGSATAKISLPSVVFGWEPYRRLAGWVTPPGPERDPLQTWFMAGGFSFSLLLTALRGQFLRWPFHPVGLAVSSSWAMNYMWFPLALAWGLKLVILRAGGLRGYRSALPFFLGLILGEFIVGSVCNLAGLAVGFEIYRFWG